MLARCINSTFCYSLVMHTLFILKRKVGYMKAMSQPDIRFARSGPEDDADPGELTHGHSVALVETVKPALQMPRRYHVMILNDDYTPMEFVIEVLERFFGLNGELATRVMLQIHHNGRAAVGSYSRDVAETKATLVVEYARQHEHPLLCQAEPMP